MAPFCPPSITQIICRSTPLNVQCRNEFGYLPLHLAIISEQCSSSKPFRQYYQCHSSLAHNRSDIIRIILEAYPDAAKKAMPGGDGRTPLCAAITSGLEWHLGDVNGTNEDNEKYRGPLWNIWKYSPESHCSRDIVTGLYPFMLAASNSCKLFHSNVDQKYEISMQQHSTDTIYSLLRLHPQLIQECIMG